MGRNRKDIGVAKVVAICLLIEALLLMAMILVWRATP